MRRPFAALFFIISLLITGLVVAGPFEDGTKAFIRGDYKTAYSLFKPLAEQGDADAQTNLGVMYEKSKGVPQDYAEAVKWYRKAAEQGNASAQFNLGLMFSKGQGVPQDYVGAAKWFRKAAEQGDADAQTNLGLMYVKGQGVPQDYVLAHMWFNLATSRYPASENERREKAEKNRDNTASKMTPAQIAEAQRLEREWKPKKEVR
jgi:hypothetical protein